MKPAFALLVVAAGASAARAALACMPAPPEHHWVRVAEEAAVITYDPATRVEHFIRRASFEADVADFGFVVPTPARPALAEADPEVLTRLDALTRPKLVYTSRVSGIDPTPLVLAPLLLRGKSAAPVGDPGVRVLDQVSVAGYDAVVLEASSPAALTEWLAQRGYARGPDVEAWVAPYVERRWYFVALRIAPKGAPGSPEKRIGSGVVDISFSTDTPVYPYREPASMRAPGARGPRSLAVFVATDARVAGTLGDRGTWAGVPTYARRLEADVQGLPGGGRGAWLTAFVDRSSPRPGVDEVYFRRADAQAELVPDPIQIITTERAPVPLDVVLGAGTGLYFVGRAIRRRRERRGP